MRAGCVVIVGGRPDGLGARLCALFNAASLADVVGDERFELVWPPGRTAPHLQGMTRALGDPREFLSAEWLSRLKIRDAFDGDERLVGHGWDPFAVRADASQRWRCGHFMGAMRLLGESKLSAHYRVHQTCSSQVFASRYCSVRESLGGQLANSMTIHARRGDIHWSPSYGARFVGQKTLGRKTIERLLLSFDPHEFDQVVIVSEDRDFGRSYAQEFPFVSTSEEIAPATDDAFTLALWDILVMAASKKVVAAPMSAFAHAATLLGSDRPLVSPSLPLDPNFEYLVEPTDLDLLFDSLVDVTRALQLGDVGMARELCDDSAFGWELELCLAIRCFLAFRNPVPHESLDLFFAPNRVRHFIDQGFPQLSQRYEPAIRQAVKRRRPIEPAVEGLDLLADYWTSSLTDDSLGT